MAHIAAQLNLLQVPTAGLSDSVFVTLFRTVVERARVILVVAWLVECCFTSREPVGLLGTGAQDDHLNFHTAPEL